MAITSNTERLSLMYMRSIAAHLIPYSQDNVVLNFTFYITY